MRINLDQTEIQKALVEYIENQGLPLTNKEVNVHLIAGRGANGHKAEIEIVPAAPPAANEEAAADPAEDQAAVPFDFGDEEGES